MTVYATDVSAQLRSAGNPLVAPNRGRQGVSVQQGDHDRVIVTLDYHTPQRFAASIATDIASTLRALGYRADIQSGLSELGGQIVVTRP
jgi:hypothetical protein